MDNPGDAKYGMTRAADRRRPSHRLQAMGAKEFGIHAFLASNTLSNDYYPALARHSVPAGGGAEGGDRLSTSPSSTSPAAWASPTGRSSPPTTSPSSARGCARRMRRFWCPPAWVTWRCTPSWAGSCWLPTAHLVTRAIHEKHIYKEYIGVDACACQPDAPGHVRRLPPHHRHGQGGRSPATTSMTSPAASARTTTSSPWTGCCPRSTWATLLVIHDTGAHGFSMGYNYNGQSPLRRAAAEGGRLRGADPPGGDAGGLFRAHWSGEETVQSRSNGSKSKAPPLLRWRFFCFCQAEAPVWSSAVK